MVFAGLPNPSDRQALIAYLETLRPQADNRDCTEEDADALP